ncbi:MAG TPA: DMT family transporter [Thermoanaerobaculia bacterium]|nr:DMT family transporter [Thermoanaerobaculia bacterium]
MPVSRLAARAALLFATLVWGATFVVVERAIEDIAVLHLLALRFALGAVLLLPLLARRGGLAGLAAASRDGVLIGVVLFAGFAFQTYGLLWTTPSRSAFLTGVSVLLVPAFGWLTATSPVRPAALAGTLAAAAGLWTLFRPFAGDAAPAFNRGDALTLGCAAAFAAHVLMVERAVRRHRVTPLAVMQFLVVAALAAPSLLLDPPAAGSFTPVAVAAVVVTGLFATAVAFACQLYAQRRLPAVEVAVVLTLEPVAAAVLSILVGREEPTLGLLVGGGLIVAGMLLADLGAPVVESAAAPTPRS